MTADALLTPAPGGAAAGTGEPGPKKRRLSLPMILLSIGSVGAGAFLVLGERLAHFLEPSIGATIEPTEVPAVIPIGLVPILTVVLMLAGAGLAYVDNRGVDGAVNGTAALLGGTSGRLRRSQTGFVRTYALTILGGSVVLVAALLTVGGFPG